MPPRTRRRMAPPMPTSSVSDVNRILYSDDCLNVLNDPLALPTDSVDLIHLDPPFNSKSIYNLLFAGKDCDARPAEAFTDTWTWGTTEDALLGELNAGPQTRIPADIVSLAQRVDTPRSGGRRAFGQHGNAAHGNAAGSGAHRVGPYSLRRHRQPLPEDGDGCHIRPAELPHGDHLETHQRPQRHQARADAARADSRRAAFLHDER